MSKVFSVTINQVKGLAISLVVLGHINSPVGALIYTFHVPLFFFLAGIFIKISYSGTEYVTKNIHRLLVPFFIFAALGLLVTATKNVFLHRPLESAGESLSGILYWMDMSHMHHYGLVLWFLPALFWARTLVFFAVKYFQLHPVVLVVASVAVAWLTALYVTLPFGLDKGLVALPWITMGYLFYQYHKQWLSSSWLGIVGGCCLTAFLIYFGGLQRLDLATKELGNLLFSIPYTLLVILLLISLFYQCNVFSVCHIKRFTDVLVLFGQHSMLVLVLHVYTNNVADIVVNHYLGFGYWFVTFFLSLFSVYVVIKIKLRYSESIFFKYL